MRTAAGSGASSQSGDHDDGHHSVVSELVSLIEHVQASMKLLEAAIAREAAPGNQEAAGNVFILDDVTPRYVEANAALNACNADLGVALDCLLDTRPTRYGTGELAASGRRPVRLINRA
jgi:hypothetical protein